MFGCKSPNLLLGSADFPSFVTLFSFQQRIARQLLIFNIMLPLSMRAPRLMRSLRLAVFVAAFAGIALLATGAAWWHVDSPGSVDACPICCHVAHISSLPGTTTAALAAPVHVGWVLNAVRLLHPGAPSFVTPPSRAPPASN
jgi:hypothetical protein